MKLSPVPILALALFLVEPCLIGASCARQNVPAASLLVPYFLVSRNGTQGEDIAEGGADTLVSVTNTGAIGLVVQVVVWNKYAKPVVSFNVPMTGQDAMSFRMKDVLNGRLNVNPNTQRLIAGKDPCGLDYVPRSGFFAFTRFPNPDPADQARAVAFHAQPAFAGAERLAIWDSLDESGDIDDLRTPEDGDNILDFDNPACSLGGDGTLRGDFSGFVTFDVVNYCTGHSPDSSARYQNDALATTGWDRDGSTPNALIGEFFFMDRRPGGHVSAEGMVAMPFEPSLDWDQSPTFYGRFRGLEAEPGTTAPAAFRFRGDGRAPLPSGFGLRYLSDEQAGLKTWLIVFRWDLTTTSSGGTSPDLCTWLRECRARASCGSGFNQPSWSLTSTTYDEDANRVSGASGPLPRINMFLATQRVPIFGPSAINIGGYRGGWIEMLFPRNSLSSQAWVSVQHSGPAPDLTLGHAASTLPGQNGCSLTPR